MRCAGSPHMGKGVNVNMISNQHDINYFAHMPAMRYYDNKDENNLKRQAMIDNEGEQCIASVKHDGCWACLIHYSKGHNLIRSRSISKVTGEYGDYTDKLPHIVKEMDEWPDQTVMLAEIAWNKPNTTANTVGTILRCLPEKAVARQSKEKLCAFAFDLLMYNGTDKMAEGYWNRASDMLDYFVLAGHSCKYIQPTHYVFGNFAVEASKVIDEGGEGLVIQHKDTPYMPDTRAAWKTLKLKKHLDEIELRVIKTIEPNEYYEGEDASSWPYQYYDMKDADKSKPNHAVTKPFFYGWKNGVLVDFNGVEVRVTSGLTDEDRSWLATDAAQAVIANGDLFAIVQAMDINSQASLRHPFIKGFRLASDGAAE